MRKVAAKKTKPLASKESVIDDALRNFDQALDIESIIGHAVLFKCNKVDSKPTQISKLYAYVVISIYVIFHF